MINKGRANEGEGCGKNGDIGKEKDGKERVRLEEEE